ncbi:universal stress protein [Oricola cellulosilytica]|uniref:Universal stress protein n=1 Tax=Oricola cellulosilytica TaxID=1429082 RepID=A0A4R0P8E5_9HYPH|nr:universal stress protein [Oricola cellulosilytica]TCD11880.1 universal stress protein [Oricola cellulosilytica]
MTPKTLLTVIGADQPLQRLTRPIELASANNCHLSVAVIGIAIAASTTAYGAIPADTWAEEREAGKKATTEQGERVEAMLAKSSVSGDVCSYYCDEGQIATVVGDRARYSDLGLAMPASGLDQRLAGKALEGFIYHSARPFLLMPAEAKVTLSPSTVMIAWNATKEAARAVHLSLDTLTRTNRVHVTMVDPVAGEFDQGEEPGNDIASYLARYGIDVRVDRLPSAGTAVSEVLLRHANDISAELIVAGAYGHSRLREFLFGGITRDLVANDRFPIIMAH